MDNHLPTITTVLYDIHLHINDSAFVDVCHPEHEDVWDNFTTQINTLRGILELKKPSRKDKGT